MFVCCFWNASWHVLHAGCPAAAFAKKAKIKAKYSTKTEQPNRKNPFRGCGGLASASSIRRPIRLRMVAKRVKQVVVIPIRISFWRSQLPRRRPPTPSPLPPTGLPGPPRVSPDGVLFSLSRCFCIPQTVKKRSQLDFWYPTAPKIINLSTSYANFRNLYDFSCRRPQKS